MELTHILIFCGIAAAIGLTPQRWRHWLILAVSIIAIYWMQPVTPIRFLDFWLPTLTIALSVIVWAVVETKADAKPEWSASMPALGIMGGLILTVAATRYTGDFTLTASAPPQITSVLIALVVIAAVTLAPTYLPTSSATIKLTTLITLLIGVLVILKAPPLAQIASVGLRSLTGQSTASATPFDIRWLGISYVAFRLLHVLFDRLNGATTLPASLPLHKFLGYVLFFPTYTAGPIDRVERYLKDADKDYRLNWAAIYTGGSRIILGLFKKFVLADLLSIIALDAVRATQVDGAGWSWIMLYAYAWRIFFDFSGLSDVAIGLGHLMGFNIPENFNKPYTQGNLTQFWNNWHMTLSQWFRSYWFNPLNRWFRARNIKSQAAMIAISQITTMILIAMWHQITLNFLIWALWHGIGLFVHNRWVNTTRLHWRKLEESRPRLRKVLGWLGVVITFHYVALGWVWFALPTPALAFETFKKLFGF